MAEEGAVGDDPIMLDDTEETAETGSDFLTHENSNESSSVGETIKDDALSFLQDLVKAKDFLSCMNCKQSFSISQNPLLLPCLNATCKECVLDLLSSNTKNIECPYCKCPHTCIENNSIVLPRDRIREDLLGIFQIMSGESNLKCENCGDSKKASHHCFDCSFFICDDCTKLHSSWKLFMNHSYVEIKSLSTKDMDSLKLFSSALFCSTPGHEEKKAELFCHSESCERLICSLCAIHTHKTHTFCEVSEALNKKRNSLKQLRENLKRRSEQSCISLQTMKKEESTCSTESEQLEKDIKSYFSKAKMCFEKAEKELCDDLKRRQKAREDVFESEKKRLSIFADSYEKACQYLDAANALHCHSSFLNVSTYMESRLKRLDSTSTRINSLCFEKMQFRSKDLESIIDAKNLGKILTTKASLSKSEVTASPLICSVGSQITFTITLKTSSGDLINDENVQVIICLDRKPLKGIQCVLGKSGAYIGSWRPEEPMKTTWHTLSNGFSLGLPMEGTLEAVDNSNRGKVASNYSFCDDSDEREYYTGETQSEESYDEYDDRCWQCGDPTADSICHHCDNLLCISCMIEHREDSHCYNYQSEKKIGNQPPGTVILRKEGRRLSGYEECDGCIVITYNIQDGCYGEYPFQKYFRGITRSGYLPNNTKGRLVAKLLNIAFTRKLVFTIGRNRATGEDGVVVWNDIFHKTRPEGGHKRLGYPDPTYLDRVLQNLEEKGVTPESADDPEEYMEYSNCFH